MMIEDIVTWVVVMLVVLWAIFLIIGIAEESKED